MVSGTDISPDVRAVLIANKDKLVGNYVSSKASLQAISLGTLIGLQISDVHAEILKGAFPSQGALTGIG
jgi:hypothetical protein